jgi:hypothetical protein
MRNSYLFHGTYCGLECSAIVVDLATFVNAPDDAEIAVSLFNEQNEIELATVSKGEVAWHTVETDR